MTALIRSIATAAPEAISDALLTSAPSESTAPTSNKRRKISPEPSPVTSVSPEPITLTAYPDESSSNSKSYKVTLPQDVLKFPPMPSPKQLTSSREATTSTLASVDEDILTTFFPLDDPSSRDTIAIDDDLILSSDDPILAEVTGADADFSDVPAAVPSKVAPTSAIPGQALGYPETESDVRQVINDDLSKLPQDVQKSYVDQLVTVAGHPAAQMESVNALADAVQKEAAAYAVGGTMLFDKEETEKNVEVANAVLDAFLARQYDGTSTPDAEPLHDLVPTSFKMET